MLKASFLNLIFSTNDKDISGSNWLIGLEVSFNKAKDNNVIATFLTTDIEDSKKAKNNTKISHTNKKKWDNLVDKIFNNIYRAQYCRLSSLVWYNNMMYTKEKHD